MSKDDFLADKRTQQAVIMNLIIIGEAATKLKNILKLLLLGTGAIWIGIITATQASAQTHKGPHDHSFSGADKWAKVFDDPKRDAWQKPHEVIKALALKPGSVLADIGSGTGYFAVRFAHMHPESRVYGVDAEPDMVKYLADRVKILPRQYFLIFRLAG